MDKFQLVSDYKLSGDQPEAVDALVKGIESGMREQTLMGRYWFRQDLYYGKRYCSDKPSNARACS